MEQIYSHISRKILKNKKTIESSLNIKLSSKKDIIHIQGKAEDEFLAVQVIEALNLGFPLEKSLTLKEEDHIFAKLEIKSITKRHDIRRIRGRIIGTHGRALDNIEQLTNTNLSLHDNTIGIIGHQQDVELAKAALEKLIRGSDHSKVYGFLEKQNTELKQKL